MEPKKNHSTKILVIILIVLILIAILTAGAYFVLKRTGANLFGDASGRYSTGDATIDTPVDTLNIDWEAGSVTVSVHDGDTISLRESGALDEDDRMRYRVEHGELTIRCRKPGVSLSSHHDKDLEVLVPAGMLRELDIDNASARVEVQGLTLSELSIDSASGDLQVSGCSVQSLSYDSASGDCELDADSTVGEFSMEAASGSADLEGAIRQLELDAVSGNLTLSTASAPEQMELDMASGRCEITLPADTGFTLELGSVSSDVTMDGFQTSQKNGRYICGDGRASYEIQMVSGSVTFHAGT